MVLLKILFRKQMGDGLVTWGLQHQDCLLLCETVNFLPEDDLTWEDAAASLHRELSQHVEAGWTDAHYWKKNYQPLSASERIENDRPVLKKEGFCWGLHFSPRNGHNYWKLETKLGFTQWNEIISRPKQVGLCWKESH